MISGLPKALADEFQRIAADKEKRKIALRERFQIEADQDDRDRQKKLREDKEDREARERLATALATPAQISAFEGRLDAYSTATVEALMENQRALDRIHDQLERMRAEAHKLPDGRSVFVTRDGAAVFDESGTPVGRDAVDPHTIKPGAPKWEEVTAAKQEEKRLNREREDALAFQAKLDKQHERVATGGLTTKDLEEIDVDLKASMPSSVASRLTSDSASHSALPTRDSPASGTAQKPSAHSSSDYRP